MAVSSAVMPWSLTLPAGSIAQWLFTLTTVDPNTGQSVPYAPAPATWEYIVRTTATDATPGGIFTISTVANAAGVIVVTNTSALLQISLTINPAATAALVPQAYYHALWSNPTTVNQYCWVTGSFIVVGNPQP